VVPMEPEILFLKVFAIVCYKYYPNAIAIATALSITLIPWEIIGPSTFSDPVWLILPVNEDGPIIVKGPEPETSKDPVISKEPDWEGFKDPDGP